MSNLREVAAGISAVPHLPIREYRHPSRFCPGFREHPVRRIRDTELRIRKNVLCFPDKRTRPTPGIQPCVGGADTGSSQSSGSLREYHHNGGSSSVSGDRTGRRYARWYYPASAYQYQNFTGKRHNLFPWSARKGLMKVIKKEDYFFRPFFFGSSFAIDIRSMI